MKIQRTLRSGLISGTSNWDFMRKREEYINQVLSELNSNGITVLRIDDEPTTRGPLGNVYGRINIFWEADTDDPVFQKYTEKSSSEKNNSSGGCYIATCVYGSYDCPQVWVLRRYRDNQLASTWYGRMFIHVYYRISPFLVKIFGRTAWFKRIWKKKIDKLIAKLMNAGTEDTPYEDKEWQWN